MRHRPLGKVAEYETRMLPRELLRQKLHEWRELLEARSAETLDDGSGEKA